MCSSVSDVLEVRCKCFVWMLQKPIEMLHMLQKLYTYVANICSQYFICSDVCCKCFIWMLYMFHTYIINVFIWMLHMFCNVFFQVFSGVFTSISDVCFKCFICLQTHVAMCSSGCFKSNQVLHMLQYDSLATTVCCSC
jgi:hypothetical protein